MCTFDNAGFIINTYYNIHTYPINKYKLKINVFLVYK